MTPARSLFGRILRRALVATLLCATLPATAETYRVDLIVFRDIYATGGESGRSPKAVGASRLIDLDDASALRAAGIELLPDAQFGLQREYGGLKVSKQFRPLMRLAWTQRNPPEDNGPSLHLRSAEGSGDAFDGSVSLLLSRYLHLDADLQYLRDGQAWPLDERRRMRRDEIHHIDSGALGILCRVTRIEGSTATP